MANEDDGAAWHRATAERIGKAVAARRKALGMTAQQLSERCRELGAPIHRSTITKIENGRPRFDLGELLILSCALLTSPVVLVYPGPYDEEIDTVPALKSSQFDAAQWFSALSEDEDPSLEAYAGVRELRTARALVEKADFTAKGGRELIMSALEQLEELKKRLAAAEAAQGRVIGENQRSGNG